MTIVKNDNADSYVKRPPQDVCFHLVHGIDEGLIHERAKILAGSVLEGDMDPLQLSRIDGDAVAREPGQLADEAYAISMFGGRRVLWIDARSRDLASTIEPLMARPPQDCTIIVEAGNLKKGAPMRSLFERSPIASSIECYPDERRALFAVIDAEAREAGLEVTTEARDYLSTLLGSDRLTTRGEVAKLMMYARGSTKVELGDVEAIVADAAPSGLEDLIDRALLGQVSEVEQAAGRFFSEGGDAGHLLARLISRLVLLHQIRLDMDQGKSFDAALQSHFIRLPASGRAALAKQAERWTSAALGKRLPAVLGVAGKARRDARLGEAITTRALWALASSARTLRR